MKPSKIRRTGSQAQKARYILASKGLISTNPTVQEKAIKELGKEVNPSSVGLGGRRRKTRRGRKSRRATRRS